jgi:hypothetical protein
LSLIRLFYNCFFFGWSPSPLFVLRLLRIWGSGLGLVWGVTFFYIDHFWGCDFGKLSVAEQRITMVS